MRSKSIVSRFFSKIQERSQNRKQAAVRARLTRPMLERLEVREVLATLPIPIVDTAQVVSVGARTNPNNFPANFGAAIAPTDPPTR